MDNSHTFCFSLQQFRNINNAKIGVLLLFCYGKALTLMYKLKVCLFIQRIKLHDHRIKNSCLYNMS